MKIAAELNYLRIAPRKVRLVARTIRGKRAPDAARSLRFLARRAAAPVEKLLRSALANAKQNFQISDPATLTVSDLTVNQGPILKRSRSRARGRAFPIHKHTSHLCLTLETAAKAAPRHARKAATSVLKAGEKLERAGEGMKPAPEREAFRRKERTVTRPTDFVRRMFRRKAI